MENMNKSIHTQNVDEVYDVPLSIVTKPLQPELDEDKVKYMMGVIQDEEQRNSLTPVDIMWVQNEKGNYYFCFGGCHRYEAHKRLNRPTIRAKLIKASESTVKLYLGASSPF